MTPRERVLAAVNHQRSDLIPADYQSLPEVTNRLIARLGLKDEEELLQYLRIDMRRIGFGYGLPDSPPDADGYVTNMWGMRYHPEKLRLDSGAEEVPFTEDSTVNDVYAHPWPSADDVDYSGIYGQCERYHETYATYGCAWSPFFHEVGWLIGQENQLMWMHTRPDLVEAVTDCVVNFDLEVTRRFLDACRGKLDIAYVGNDFGTQRGLYFSPGQYDRFIRPWLRKFFALAHDYGCKTMQHSCGSVRDIIPWLIEDGADILNPIQIRAAGMSLDSLVADFGDRLAFHGGIDTQHTLPFGTVDDVREQVRSYRELTRERGSYILCSSQEFMADISDENILAMYETARD